jgi:hypothetical protein
MVNEALLSKELTKQRSTRSSRESLNRLGQRSVSNNSLANGNRELEKEDKMSDKMSEKLEPEAPSQGRMSRLSNPGSENTNKSADFFDNARIEGQGILNDSDQAEDKDKLMSAIRSEFQRLSTS